MNVFRMNLLPIESQALHLSLAYVGFIIRIFRIGCLDFISLVFTSFRVTWNFSITLKIIWFNVVRSLIQL